MDAWEILTSNSSLAPVGSYDAWEHLGAQEGGGGLVIIAATFDADLAAQDTTADAGVTLSVASIETTLTAFNVAEALTISINEQILEVDL
jgi:hypothetical protein